MPPDKEERPWIAKDLGYNYLPEPYVECDIREFWYRFFTYDAKREFRQMHNPDTTCRGNVVIFWFYDIAYALECPLNWATLTDGLSKGKIGWLEAPRCFRIGCQHEYKELSQSESRALGIPHHGKCWHVTKCEKCGNVTSFDSSD